MKKILTIILCCFATASCATKSIGIIGGADGPTAIVVGRETDEWGLSLLAENVTNAGLTIAISQSGGNTDGALETGEWFCIEKNTGSEWQELEVNPLIDYGWSDISYLIGKNTTTRLQVEWEWLYGELDRGQYRLNKKVHDFKATGNYAERVYQVYFAVE